MLLKQPRVGRQRGFTLVELMITVVIIGILASIGIPSYRDYVRRGQVADAVTFLSDYRVKMEQYFQDNKNYGTGTACATGTNTPAWSAFSASQYFTYACTLRDSGQGYLITATGSNAAAVGHVYTVDEENVRATTKFRGDTVSKSCWLLKGDEC